jgi:hypothetical protein
VTRHGVIEQARDPGQLAITAHHPRDGLGVPTPHEAHHRLARRDCLGQADDVQVLLAAAAEPKLEDGASAPSAEHGEEAWRRHTAGREWGGPGTRPGTGPRCSQRLVRFPARRQRRSGAAALHPATAQLSGNAAGH